MASRDQETSGLGRAFSRAEPTSIGKVERIIRGVVAAKGYGIPLEERRDLQQEIMMQLWKAVREPGFDAGARFPGFVQVVASRRCLDWYRARKPVGELEVVIDPRADTESRAVRREKRQLARGAVAALPEPCRELISLRFGREMSYPELAARLGVSEGAIRVRLHRCIGKAKRWLERGEVVAIDSRKRG